MSVKTKGVILVPIQFILMIAIIGLPHGDVWAISKIVGNLALLLLMAVLAIALLGIVSLGNSLTATPVPKATSALRTLGMYSIVRHPI
jgi:protein-S-isoprenylcysteine O-methyltransferase Ste14